jgi:hypothetical protein
MRRVSALRVRSLAVVLGVAAAAALSAQERAAPNWSLQALRAVDPPGNGAHPIDAFVQDRLLRAGLAPSPRADRVTLLRRLSFDLRGLPPSPAELDEFLADRREDAFERWIDRLLASPQSGERFGRFWLDVVHYGDTHGFDKDKPRPHAWRYRDWVVSALNDDLPYARFVELQLAGDVSDGDDGIPATGFIAAGPWDFVGHTELREGTVDKAITRSLDRDDMLKATLATFCSTTVHCARCHDHKYDPIPTRDYYRLQAVFAGVERADRAWLPRATREERAQLDARERALTARETALHEAIEARAGDALAPLVAALERARAAMAASPLPSAQVDGRTILGWHSQIAPRDDVMKWVQVDLGRHFELDGILLLPCHERFGPHPGPGFGFPRRFRVELADDPDFTAPTMLLDGTAADVAAPGDAPLWIDAAGRGGRFVRVTATRLFERTADFAFALAELAAFDREGIDRARGARVTALDSIEMGERWALANLTDGRSSLGVLDDGLAAHRAHARARWTCEQHEQRRAALLARHRSIEEAGELAEITTARAALASRREELAPALVYAAATDFAPIGAFAPPHGIRPIHVLHRGELTSEREPVGPGALSCLPELEHHFAGLGGDDEGARRLALARWITDPANPLTWRSIVNRVWQFHFGRGLVDTPNDFGRLGSQPSHPELLDWLAVSFRDSGGSLRALHRLILTSATWQQRSDAVSAANAIDGGNALLARQNRRRLDAESFRDLVLAVSARLDLSLGGPPEPQFRFEDDHSPRYLYSEFDVDAGRRRALYRMLVRSVPDPFFEALDCADPSQLVPRRNETLTALHALAIWNDRFVLRHAEHLAARVERESASVREALALAMRLVLARRATDTELDALVAHATAHGLPSACRVILNLDETIFVD